MYLTEGREAVRIEAGDTVRLKLLGGENKLTWDRILDLGEGGN